MNSKSESYRGQWGGKIESGEEMWWTEPDRRLRDRSFFRRIRFYLDVRQHFLIRFLRYGITAAKKRGVEVPKIVDFGCGTGGTGMNFSHFLGIPFQGFDIFQTQIGIAQELAQKFQSPCTFGLLNADGSFPLPDQSIDVIFSADVLGHVPDIPKTLAHWARALKTGGVVSLFTESTHSLDDQSQMAQLSRQGFDMVSMVPEHISLFPKEKLEAWFRSAGFEILDRVSANVGHWFFFPKDYVTLLKNQPTQRKVYLRSLIWSKISKILPFYPIPHEFFRLVLTYFFGRSDLGTAYFYLLRKN